MVRGSLGSAADVVEVRGKYGKLNGQRYGTL